VVGATDPHGSILDFLGRNVLNKIINMQIGAKSFINVAMKLLNKTEAHAVLAVRDAW
jgi:hypothetical protein